MVKKPKSLAAPDDKEFADAVRLSAQQIWQAGLGAFAKAQEEGGKMFAKLVKEGTQLQKRTQELAEGKVSEVADTVSKVADSVSKQASGSWDKLEQVFEDRVARSLNNLGVPTRDDIQLLTTRIAELSEAVDALASKREQTTKAPGKTATRKVGAKSPAAKKSVTRKSSRQAST